MPELPDVEMMRRYLAHTSLHQRVENVRVLDDYVIKEMGREEFRSRLEGVTFDRVERRGKFLEVFTDSVYDLAIHFGMTGYLKYVTSSEQYTKYVRVVFRFRDRDLRYVAKRKLGGLYLVKNGRFSSISTIREMGPEPLDSDFSFDKFRSLTEGRFAMTKALLLDQSFIAGVGNVYADEILFQAGIRPGRRISDLDEEELQSLYKGIRRVLRTAIKHQVDLQDLKDIFLTPHRESDGQCPRCAALLKTTKISSRTSYWCERCQK